MIFKTIKSSINDISIVGSTLTEIGKLKLDATNISGYATALKGLSTQQAQLVMSTKGLTTAQQQAVLSQISLANATGTLTTSQMTSALITETRNEADAKALLLNAGLISSETAEATATNAVTAAKLRELVATGQLTKAEAQLLATKAGVTLENQKQASFFGKLGNSLKSVGNSIKSIVVNHPILTAITVAIGAITTAITIAEKKNEEFIESQKKLIEEIDENISKYDEEISSLDSLQEKLQNAKGDKEALASIQSELNQAIGDTPGLLNEESNAYDIANQKIDDRIERLKELRKLELEDKVTAQKEIFNNTLVDNAMGIDHKFGYFSNHKIIASDTLGSEFSGYLEGINANKFETLQLIFEALKKNGYGNGEKSNAEIWKELIDSYGGAMLDVEEIQNYFDNQTEYAKKILSDYVNNSESIFSKEELNSIIEDLVESGYSQDLEGIENVITSLVENDELEKTINDYYESLYNDDIDSDALYQNIKSQFDTLVANYPELKGILENYFNSIGKDIETGINNASQNPDGITVSYTDVLSQFQKLSEGFDQLDKIYTDVYDKEEFDWSSILNNKEFIETFKEMGESYDDFIKQVSQTPDDLEACQEAFDNLATSYIYTMKDENGRNIMSNLTSETKDATVAMLEHMGVVNALEVVEAQLVINEQNLANAKRDLANICAELARNVTNEAEAEFLAKVASTDLANATFDEIIELINEANQLGINTKALVTYALQKAEANNITLNTSADVANLLSMAKAAGIASSAISKLASLKANYDKAVVSGDTKAQEFFAGKLKEESSFIENQLANYKPEQATVNYGGGSSYRDAVEDANKASKEKAEKEKEAFEEVFDWIERKLKDLQHKANKWQKYAESALTGEFVVEYFAKLRKNLYAQMGAQSAAFDTYMAKANESGLSEEYAKKVREGSIEIETITDETLAEQIKAYQENYDKAVEAMDGFEEAVEQRFNIPLERCAKRIEKFAKNIELLETKLDNAIGYKTQNKLINQELKQERKIVRKYEYAEFFTSENVKNFGKKLVSVLNSPDVSAEESKLIKSSVKNQKEIDMEMFEIGSDAYEYALKYNYALKASAEATYNLQKAQEEYTATLRDARKQQFDNVATQFDNKVGYIDNNRQDIDNQIAEIEGAGKRLDSSYYTAQKNLTEQIQTQREKELKKLQNRLEKMRKAGMEGSDEWYDALDEIQSVQNAISECTQNMYEFNNAINDLHFDIFNDIADGIGRIIDEQEFLQGLFAHEKSADEETGGLTEAGIARLGSISAQYYAAKENTANNSTILNELNRMIETGERYSKLLGVEFNSTDDLINKRNEYASIVQDNYKQEYNLVSSLVDVMKEKYEAELAYVNELINAQKEALQAEKDLHDYQRTIDNQVKDINILERQLVAYQGDSSEEGMARLHKLQQELNEKQDELADTEYDKKISDSMEMLTKLSEEYGDKIAKKMDDFYALFEEGKSIADTKLSSIDTYLSKVADKNGYTQETKNLFNGVSGNIKTSIETATTKIETAIRESKVQTPPTPNPNDGNNSNSSGNSSGIIGESISTSVSENTATDKKSEYLALAKDFVKGNVKVRNVDKDKLSDVNKKIYKKYDGKTLTAAKLEKLAELLDVKHDGNSKDGKLYKKLKSIKFPGFSKGGVVAVDDIEKQVKANGDTVLGSLNQGERILTPVQNELFEKFINNGLPQLNATANMLQPLVNMPKLPEIQSRGNNIEYGDISFNFQLEGIKDTNEFLNAIQTDRKVQKAIQSVSIDLINGGNRLGVKRIR